ncbi:hypothetical protein [Actinomadura welshii]|uniref:hypothetical protein n=1 Tax=Actinomadura welshii TaxID=3103817 RepID=UPI0003AD0BC2|nr:hypothetical protein [Actinomadura madurae]
MPEASAVPPADTRSSASRIGRPGRWPRAYRFVPGPVRDRAVGVLALATGLPPARASVPDHFRARGLGVLPAGLITVQGLGVLVSGAVASVIGS